MSDYDFEGNARVQQCRVDIGCDESPYIGLDCNANGYADACDLADCDGSDWCSDCNANHVPDGCDVDPNDPDGNGEVSEDCSANGIPDECEPDCNENGEADSCDIFDGTSPDCNADGIPDECNLAECDGGLWCRDCNGNLVPDICDIDAGTSLDCNANGIPDECDVADCDGSAWCSDCNENDIPDECDISTGTSEDCTGNGIPDECEPDCNENDVADSCDIDTGTSLDCNTNDIPDECDLTDCDGSAWCSDCNTNGILDACDISSGFSEDCNTNSVPDECEPGGTADCNTNGEPDLCDIHTGYSQDCNANAVPDDCDINPADPDGNGQVSTDVNVNGIPDECETDCNENGLPDVWEISSGVFTSDASWAAFEPSSHGVGDHQGYTGVVSDGRYLYFAPYGDPVTPHGEVLRYDTSAPFGDPAAWAAYEYASHCGGECESPRGYKGACFDGQFVYFVPFHNGGNTHGEFLRYDTTGPFTEASSWDTYDVCAGFGAHGGYNRGAYDPGNGYMYFAPHGGASAHSWVLRYDVSEPFDSASSWQEFNTGGFGALGGYADVVFDGQYMYFLPGDRNPPSSTDVIRYNTAASFTENSSWEKFDPPGDSSYYGGVLAGQHVYLAPQGDSTYAAALRYDNSGGFESPGSWESYDITDSGGGTWTGATEYRDAATDGSFVYFAPYAGPSSGAVLRYDFSETFTSASAWESHQFGPGVFEGAVCTETHLFLAPGDTGGTILRFNLLQMAQDCNANLVPDECEPGGTEDCNNNDEADLCDIYAGTSQDCNENAIPDECEPGSDQDCNTNGAPDFCDIFSAVSRDCNDNGVPDECDISGGTSQDCQPNGIPDECEVVSPGEDLGFDNELSWSSFRPQSHGVGAHEGYRGVVSDDRYVYFVPYGVPGGSHGEVLRYDTHLSFQKDSAWRAYYYGEHCGDDCDHALGYMGGVFDGQYVYFVPYHIDGLGQHGEFLRYDTTGDFESTSSWSTYDACAGISASGGYHGAAIDWSHEYIYFAPVTSGKVLRHDMSGAFNSPSSWEEFDLAGATGAWCDFRGAVFDGRYMYFLPGEGVVARFDTTADFQSASSWSTFDPAGSEEYFSGAFDGRYIYFAPYSGDRMALRYDTSGAFDAPASWLQYDFTGFGGIESDYRGTVWDGRYVYYVPWSYGGGVLRYDTHGVFNEASSWILYEYALSDACANDPECSNPVRFEGAVYIDGYVYFGPAYEGGGEVLRYTAGVPDCNANGVPDKCDIRDGVSEDLDGNGIPDECESDCNDNGISDFVEMFECDDSPWCGDCNGNEVLDECDIADGTSTDLNGNGEPDECEPDCNGNRVPDDLDVAQAVSEDCQLNGIPDECESDCNENGVPDDCDIAVGTSLDCQPNGIPDECDTGGETGAGFDKPDSWTTYIPGYGERSDGIHVGQYVYFVPYWGGTVLRLNVAADFATPAAWTTFNACSTIGANGGYHGGVFDGRYIYFVPYHTGSGHHAEVLRYDTQSDFADPGSWAVFDADAAVGSGNGFESAAFDSEHGYVYFAPVHAAMLRYDTSGPFDSAASWQTSSAVTGSYKDAVCAGQYVYFVGGNRMRRFDTSGAFTDPASWSESPVWDDDYFATDYDGRYVYVTPDGHTNVLRYDTQGDFTSGSAWQSYDYSELSGGETWTGVNYFRDVVAYGDYVYFIPYWRTGDGPKGDVLRYNRGGSFDDVAYWSVYNYAESNACAADPDCISPAGFNAAVCDGRYMYFSPSDGNPGEVLRYSVGDTDCNDNAVPDECDIRDGFSDDLNGNGIPDECEEDCNTNGVFDYLDIAGCDGSPWCDDCNGNGVPDECDIAGGTSDDININGIPDECEVDCNTNGIFDYQDLANCDGSPWCSDCNGNGVLDECDIAASSSDDYDLNGVPDECDPDCNANGVPDTCDLECATGNCAAHPLGCGASSDCQPNGVPDECDVAAGTSADVNENGVPDECELDCNNNGVPDAWDIALGTSQDCQPNGVPDECDISDATSDDYDLDGVPDECDADCNANGVPDACDLECAAGDCATHPLGCGGSSDCQLNGVPDDCDISSGTSQDCNQNQVPDECDIADCDPGDPACQDCNANGIPDECDIAAGASEDCNSNGVPDECDIATGMCQDCQPNGVPDECDIAIGTSVDFDGDGVPDECELACIGYAPADLVNTSDEGENAPTQTFEVWNCNIGTLSYGITDDADWLDCQPSSGTSTGEADTITCTYTTAALEPGEYSATITISDPAAENDPQTVAVSLTVSECYARRDLSVWRPCYTPEVAKPVSITLEPATGTSAVAVEDRPPTGWTVSSISDGGYWDAVYQKVKWGPFFEPFPDEVSYEVTAPAGATGQYCFTGVISLDGANTPTCGDACIAECSTCPPIAADSAQPVCDGCADCSCATCEDFRVEMCEMIGYACAWKRGCNDDLSGMTRGAYLWRTGEYYCWDDAQSDWMPSDFPPPADGCCDGGRGRGDRGDSHTDYLLASRESECWATWWLTKPHDSVGHVAELTVEISIDAPEGAQAAALEFHIPRNWEILEISDAGQVDEVHEKVKWGPFFDHLSRTLTFTVRPLAQEHALTHQDGSMMKLGGTISIDGLDQAICTER